MATSVATVSHTSVSSAPLGRTMLPLQVKAGSRPPIVAAQSMWIIPTRRFGLEVVQSSLVTTAMSPSFVAPKPGAASEPPE